MDQVVARLKLLHSQAKQVICKSLEIIRLTSFSKLIAIRQLAKDSDTILTPMASSGVYFTQSSPLSYHEGEPVLGDAAIACCHCAAQRNVSELGSAQPISFAQNATPASAFLSLPHKDSCCFTTSSNTYSIDEQGPANPGELF